MPTIQIGRAEIAYELRRSATAAERRITVTPGHVEVLALTTDSDEDIGSFLNRKRQWLFDAVRGMESVTAARHAMPRFTTGSKVLYRGRLVPLTVRRTSAERAVVSFRKGFFIDLPHWSGERCDQLVASELKHWMKARARRDVREIAAGYRAKFGLVPRSIKAAELVRGWGSCGVEGSILINWHLILAPKKVLEYVVAHELTHLRVRSHGREFWDLLARFCPDYRLSKAWLETHQASLSADFLDC